MTIETGSPAGGEAFHSVELPADAPESFRTPSEAAAYFTSLLENPEKSAAESAEPATAEQELSDEGNADPVTDPGETEEAEAAQPPIERPKSWSKDEDTEWQSLPRTMQQKIVARELERDTGTTRSQQKAADAEKAAQAKADQAEQVRKQYEAQLPALMQTLQDAQQSAFADIRTVDDVTKLANEDPFRYLQWQAHQTKLQAINAELERAKGQQTQEYQTQWTQHVQKENELAAEIIPELADKDKAPILHKRAADRLGELGFKPEELNDLASGKQKLSIYDHRIQQLIFSDLKLSDIQKAPKAISTKPVPPVQRPGTSKPQGSIVSDRIQALEVKFNKTGSLKDAQALYAAQLEAQSRRRAS